MIDRRDMVPLRQRAVVGRPAMDRALTASADRVRDVEQIGIECLSVDAIRLAGSRQARDICLGTSEPAKVHRLHDQGCARG
jgi:hypothetical protein